MYRVMCCDSVFPRWLSTPRQVWQSFQHPTQPALAISHPSPAIISIIIPPRTTNSRSSSTDQNVQTNALPIHGSIFEVVPLARTAATTVLLLLLPVGVVIVLTGDVALGAPLLRALGLRHSLVSSAAIRETKSSMSKRATVEKKQVIGEFCDQNYEGTSSTNIYGTSKRGKENPHPTSPNKV